MDDLISRQAAIEALGEKPLDWTEGEYELGRQNQWEHDVDAIKALSPVTPKPKTGHWELVQRGKSIDVCCSNCKAVRIKRYAYGYTIDQLDKEYVKERFESDDMRYCPNCGAKMDEEV